MAATASNPVTLLSELKLSPDLVRDPAILCALCVLGLQVAAVPKRLLPHVQMHVAAVQLFGSQANMRDA